MIRGLLLGVTLALAGLLVWQWLDWPRTLPAVATRGPGSDGAGSSGDPQTAQVPTLAPTEPKETYASVAERPLFRPQRKPEPPPSAEPATETAPEEAGSLEGADLSAVLISPGVTLAWIKDPSAPDLKRLRLGDDHAGWSVKDIRADRVVFERQGETNELILRDFAQPSSPPAAPVPARPSPAAQRLPPPREPQRAQAPGGDQRVAPPQASQPPQLRPNVRRPPPQRPQ